MTLLQYIQNKTGENGRVGSNGVWFHSPLHEERTPSFQVNENIGKWHDWGNGQYGDLIDIIRLVEKCDYATAKALLENTPGKISVQQHKEEYNAYKKRNYSVGEFRHTRLIEYANSRCVDTMVLQQYCTEIQEGNFFYIALKNIAGGYAIRNQNFKGQLGANSYTFVDNNSDELLVFEGMFDFLSFATISDISRCDVVILNSTTNAAKIDAKKYEKIHLYLDNDNAGNSATDMLMQRYANAINHQSNYSNCNDVNEFIVNQKKQG